MKIIQPKNNGFCSGVKRAVKMALDNAGENVYCLGEIVHNPLVVKQLEDKGITIIDDVSNLKKGDTLIITAHGASKYIFDFCESKGINIVDTTCPFVKVLHDKATEYYKKNYHLARVLSLICDKILYKEYVIKFY